MAENVLTRKIGPLPTWGWVSIVGAGVVGVALWERHVSGNAASSASGTDLTPPEVIQVFPPEQDSDEGTDDDTPNRKHKRHASRAVKVPDVIGEDYMEGAAKIKKAGLTGQRATPFVGRITSESPSAGSHVQRGTTVTLRGKPWPQTQRGAGGRKKPAAGGTKKPLTKPKGTRQPHPKPVSRG